VIRVNLDLNEAGDRSKVKGTWRRAVGLVPGEPNQGVVAEMEGSPVRLADYDDSGWETCDNVGDGVSTGVCFAWWRITIEVPQEMNGVPVEGSSLYFETTIDDYGEIWVNGEIDLPTGAFQGFNIPQRILLTRSAVPGEKFVIACLGANGPMAKPGGGVFMRYAVLGLEKYR
jgi:hypothetical protein